MSKFANLRKATSNPAPEPIAANADTGAQARAGTTQANRLGRKAISGYFSPEMSIAMRSTAIKRGLTLQEAMAEAFNLWLRENGASPIGD